MSLEEKVTLIKHLETNFAVIEWKIGTLDVWPMIRSEFVFFGSGKKKVVVEKYSVWRVIRQLFSTCNLILKSIDKSQLVVTSDTKRTKQGHRFIDFLHKKLGIGYDDIVVAEVNAKKDMLIPKVGYPVYHLIYFFDRYARLKGFFKREKLEASEFEEVVMYLKSIQSPAIELFDFKRIEKKAQQMLSIYSVWSSILKKGKIKRVLMEAYYGIFSLALCAASEDQRIPVIEMQHGVQGPKHLGYGSFSKLPAHGYNTIPDVFWVWTKSDASNIDSWVSKTIKHESYVGGYTNLVELKTKKLDSKKPNILFTTQPVEGYLPDSLSHLIKETANDFDWYFRLHPRQIEEEEKVKVDLGGHGILDIVDIETLTRGSAVDALSQVDLHLTLWSSCVIEAHMLGVPSILLHENGLVLYEGQMDDLNATFPNKLTQEIINDMITKRHGGTIGLCNGSVEDAASLAYYRKHRSV